MNISNWNLLRSFVAVLDTGSLSAASRRLGLSQPTLGRHIAELEAQVGERLFVRHRRGLEPTDAAMVLTERARAVADAVAAFERSVVGREEHVAGTVRISASEVVAVQVLPALLARLRRRHPRLELEVVADNAVTNLLRRDADIAIRMVRPTQQGLVARKVADAEMGLFASVDYLERLPASCDPRDISQHTLVGFDRDDLHLRALARLGIERRREDFAIRSDAQTFALEAAIAGLGVAAVQVAVARRARTRPPLVRLAPELPLPVLPVWLVVHEDLRSSARVRAVFDFLAEALAAYYAPPKQPAPEAAPAPAVPRPHPKRERAKPRTPKK